MDDDDKGMVRKPDHATSQKAARKIVRRKGTVRDLVLQYAMNAPNGFTDEDMRRMRPDWSESTARKRRTELTQENIILDTKFERTNGHGNPEKVWIHRDFVPNPPDIVDPPEPLPARKFLVAEIERLREILRRNGIGF